MPRPSFKNSIFLMSMRCSRLSPNMSHKSVSMFVFSISSLISSILKQDRKEHKYMTTTANSHYWWHRYTSAESFQRILDGEDPWVAIGDFLDEWYREESKDRVELVADPIASRVSPTVAQWAAFFSAMVEDLCVQDGLPVPIWTENKCYILDHPW